MKLGQVLFKQHTGRMRKFIWEVQRERPILPTKAEEVLKPLNCVIEDAIDLVPGLKIRHQPTTTYKITTNKVIRNKPKINVVPAQQPDPSIQPTYAFEDNYLLQEGLTQAQLLTKTIIVGNTLPIHIQNLIQELSSDIHLNIRRVIATSTIFNAHQEKLPKKKDPQRPAWNFPREYGITRIRQMSSLTRNMIQQCEMHSRQIVDHRNIVENAEMQICLKHMSDTLNLSTKVDLMLTSVHPISQFQDSTEGISVKMPDIYPLHPFLDLEKQVTQCELHFPIAKNARWWHPHTIFLHHDPETVKNRTEIPATEYQILGQALMRSFTTAACYARYKYGNVDQLPDPVTVQFVHTNGRLYNLGVFQLNTLNFSPMDNIKNYLWLVPSMPLFTEAGYDTGKPVLHGYNEEVFNTITAFYRNEQ